jgi:hypothetical protein
MACAWEVVVEQLGFVGILAFIFVVGSHLSSEGRIPLFCSIKSAFSLPTSAAEAEIGLYKLTQEL